VTRGGRTKDRSEAERKCIATGSTGAKSGLIRFVVGPDEQIVPDITERLPGRGIWVSADRAALEKAVKNKLFSRAAKAQVKVDAGLPDLVTTILARRVIDTLALARKAGQAVAGFEKVKSMLELEKAAALLQASDGSAGMKSKLRYPNGPESYVNCLTSEELGVAFGRKTVVHAAVSAGGLADLCLSEATRLNGMRAKARPESRATRDR